MNKVLHLADPCIKVKVSFGKYGFLHSYHILFFFFLGLEYLIFFLIKKRGKIISIFK